MRTVSSALAIVLAVSFGARAEEGKASHSGGGHGYAAADTGLFFLDLLFDAAVISLEAAALEDAARNAPPPPAPAYAQRSRDDDDPPPRYSRDRRRPQSREGLLLSFGLGGGSLYVSTEDPTRVGAFDLDFRLGYGFSDRFQFFMDLNMDAASYRNHSMYGSDDVASWSFTFRGQTVLLGDRAGNGLNLNLGLGLGGITYNSGYYDQTSSPAGLAVAGGLSYDARISPWFAISPEFFYTWHAIPTEPGAHEVTNVYGLRVNFLWYLH
jgi:hypothetical protein